LDVVQGDKKKMRKKETEKKQKKKRDRHETILDVVPSAVVVD